MPLTPDVRALANKTWRKILDLSLENRDANVVYLSSEQNAALRAWLGEPYKSVGSDISTICGLHIVEYDAGQLEQDAKDGVVIGLPMLACDLRVPARRRSEIEKVVVRAKDFPVTFESVGSVSPSGRAEPVRVKSQTSSKEPQLCIVVPTLRKVTLPDD